MKRIDTRHSWNWVDENNRMVGFANGDQCCEDYGYTFVSDEDKELDLDDKLEDYSFTGLVGGASYTPEDYDQDDCNTESFEMTSKDGSRAWLVLWNHHNGYYSHSFEFKNGDETILDGDL